MKVLLVYYYIFVVIFIGIIYDFSAFFFDLNIIKIIGLINKDLLLIIILLISFLRRNRNILIDSCIFLLFILLLFNALLLQGEFEFIPMALTFRNYLVYASCIYIGYYYYDYFLKFDNIRSYQWIVYLSAFLVIIQYLQIYPNEYKALIGGNDVLWVHGGQISRIEFSFIAILILCRMLAFLRDGQTSKNILILTATIFILIYLSQSRAALVIAFVFLLEYLISTRRYVEIIIGILAISFAYLILDLDHRILSNPIGFNDPRFVNIYQYALDLIFQNLFFGHGLASFGPATIYSNFIVKDPLHYVDSTVLSSLLQFGLIGTLIYLLPYIYLIFNPIKDKKLRYSVFSLTIILFSFGVFYNAIDGWPGGVIFFTLIGILYAKGGVGEGIDVT
jgi:hypothetical protein